MTGTLPSTIHQPPQAHPQPPPHPPSTGNLPRRPPREAANPLHLPPHHPLDPLRHHPSHHPHPLRHDTTNVGHTLHGSTLRRQRHCQRQTTPTTLRLHLRCPLRLHPQNPNGPRRPLLRPPPQNPRRHLLHFPTLGTLVPHPHRPLNPYPPRGRRENKERVVTR